jgi:putative NADH-flavin reductase
MTKITVIGASRGIGKAVTELALQRGFSVRAFARSADGLKVDHPKLEKVVGDARSIEQVRAGIAGCDAVLQILGVRANAQMITGPITLFSEATRVLIEAMRDAGPKRLIALTGFGAGASKAAIPPLQRLSFNAVFGRAYADKDIQEELIKESGLDWIIARPGVLTNGPFSGRYRILTAPKSWRNGIISRADVADFMLNQVASDAHLRKAPVLVRW